MIPRSRIKINQPMKYILSFLLISTSFIAFAQPKEVQIELNETFAHYQNAYNNATEAYKMLTKGYKRSASMSDARYYLGSARKYMVKASEYCLKASKRAQGTLTLAVVQSCKHSNGNYSKMDEQFIEASQKFLLSKSELDLALAEESDFNVIGNYMSTALTYMQSGVEKLNIAIEEMNSGSSNMKKCN